MIPEGGQTTRTWCRGPGECLTRDWGWDHLERGRTICIADSMVAYIFECGVIERMVDRPASREDAIELVCE